MPPRSRSSPKTPTINWIRCTHLLLSHLQLGTLLPLPLPPLAERVTVLGRGASATASAAVVVTSPSPEQADALRLHNEARRGKGVTPLAWDAGLAGDAEAYARVLAGRKKLAHADVDDQGENLFSSTGPASLSDAVRGWLAESKNWHDGEKIGEENLSGGGGGGHRLAVRDDPGHLSSSGGSGVTGHYTQCMWNSTTNVGIAKALGRDGSTWVVARYTPPGNWIGEAAY